MQMQHRSGKSLSKSENQSIDHIIPNGVNSNSISGKVIRTLSAYPYPMVPKFTGMGDVNGKKF